MKSKALVLFSGGLDSRLAIKILQDQNIEVEALYIKLPFGEGCCNNQECVFNYSQVNGIKLNILDCTTPDYLLEYLKIIINPRFKKGRSMNPCNDCRIFLFKKAKEFKDLIKADFIATGEVLDERPVSQKKNSLLLIDEQADLKDQIVRPLSAKLLPITLAEKNKLIDRNKLLDIQGRQRKIQIGLAKKYNINFPNPGGGCLLCEKLYCKKLKDILENKKLEDIAIYDILLLKIGRHFRSKGKIVLGKNNNQNILLGQLNKSLNWNIMIPSTPGPTIIYENKDDGELAVQMLKAYSDKNIEMIKALEKYKIN